MGGQWFTVQWRETVRRYPDGDIVWLRFPQIGIRALAFGTLEPETAMSMRVAPPAVVSPLMLPLTTRQPG